MAGEQSPRSLVSRLRLPRLAEARRRDRRLWVATFVLFWTIASVWGLSVPIFSAPDEQSHVIKAAAVARGQLLGEQRETTFPPFEVTVVEVPAIYRRADTLFLCYLHHPERPAGCALEFEGPTENAPVPTLAGKYPPYYYAAAGGPSLVAPSVAGLYAMRVVSAALSAAFLASALLSARALARRRLMVVGLAAAVTPTALYLAGVVNPNGVEIAAAVALWVAAGAFLEAPDHPAARRLLLRVAAAGATLAVARGAGYLWLAGAGVVLVMWHGWRPSLALARRRDVQATVAVLALAVVAALGWAVLAGLFELTGAGLDDPLAERLRTATGSTGEWTVQMIAEFGFRDAPAPFLTIAAWLAVTGWLLLSALTSARARAGVAIGVLLGAVVLVPIVLEARGVPAIGYFWLGRYTLPLAAGLPVLAALQVARQSPGSLNLNRRLVALPLGLLAVAHVAAYYWAVRRYAVGIEGPLDYVTGPTDWSGPLPLGLLLAVFVAATAALAVLLHRVATEPSVQE